MKKETFRKLTSSIVFVSLLISSLSIISCSQGDPVSTEQTETTQIETVTERLQPDLPDVNYDGIDVRIMQHSFQTGGWQDWCSRDLFAETSTGEPINDAVYARNLLMSEKYGLNIIAIDNSDMPNMIKKQVLAGTDDYHISTARIQSLTGVIQSGYLCNLYNIPNIDLTKPWYDQSCITDATLYNTLFYVTSSMLILDDDSTGAIVFNKKLITDFGLDNPYDLVLNGTWTLDKLSEMAEVVASDLDGDGEATLADRFGLFWQRDAIISFLHAGNCRIVTLDGEGNPEFTLMNDRTISLMETLDALVSRKDIVVNFHNYESKFADIYAEESKLFSQNQALFMWVRMRVVANLRNMESDFGIIPVTKFDEAQEHYYSTVNKYTAATVCIPNSPALDLDMVGLVVEAMSGEGYYGLHEAYYDINLGQKIARDPESTEMLDIIMSSRVYDTGEIYDIGSVATDMYYLTQKDSLEFASFIAKKEKAAEKQLSTFIKNMSELSETFK